MAGAGVVGAWVGTEVVGSDVVGAPVVGSEIAGESVGVWVGFEVGASDTGAQHRQSPQVLNSEPVNTLQLMPLCRKPEQPCVVSHSSAHSAKETTP